MPETGPPVDYDVLIVGAGIAGSALAVALSGQGLRIALVEARALPPDPGPVDPGLNGFDIRVSALTPRSVDLLARLADRGRMDPAGRTRWHASQRRIPPGYPPFRRGLLPPRGLPESFLKPEVRP